MSIDIKQCHTLAEQARRDAEEAAERFETLAIAAELLILTEAVPAGGGLLKRNAGTYDDHYVVDVLDDTGSIVEMPEEAEMASMSPSFNRGLMDDILRAEKLELHARRMMYDRYSTGFELDIAKTRRWAIQHILDNVEVEVGPKEMAHFKKFGHLSVAGICTCDLTEKKVRGHDTYTT